MTYEIKYRSEEEMKDSGIGWLGEIPKDWIIGSLRWYISCKSGDFLSNHNVEREPIFNNIIPVIGGNGITGYSEKYNTKKETLAIGRVGALCGNVHYINFLSWITDNSLIINHNSKKVYIKYLEVLLRTINLNQFSTSTAQPLITSETVKKRSVALPTLENQKKIANFLDHKTSEFDSIISKKEKLIKKLEEAKKSLISEVVTGKVKIVDGELVERKADEMKDSGVNWLGIIPIEWEVTKIKHISSLNKKTLSNNTRNNLEMQYIDIGSVDNTGSINYIQELMFKDAPSRAKRIVTHNDTIVSTVRTYLKAIAYIDNKYDGFICSTGFAVLTPIKRLINPKYFYYIINSEEYINQIVSRSTGVSYPAINAIEISNLPLLLPKLQEQILIVIILEKQLNRINSIISKTKLQIRKLKQAKQSLISEAVTGKIDLRDWEIQ